MNIEEFRDYCIAKKAVTEEFPFNEEVLVFKVMGKMFALTSLKKWEQGDHSINLKCNPERSLELREQYEGIYSGYHMHGKHWNTVDVGSGELRPAFIRELIDHSYELVVKGLPKKIREEFERM
ncbi:MmcQ/YjbR family DNA-binding protein [Leptobacterium flavescens]|uniref:MmcQ/YjbR family DNA-binding protein n=1 Tax=Leptobacterium flavescens TaxID=472055 RepID=A0A6P0UIF5_9FLAO|nr:MmcQ/YjbR family DNA-binding protein [Leptobacterium flavescens]NER12777.1 MmcQ/YjbR family DNA-binding protein [Leptobacterium flavescens]